MAKARKKVPKTYLAGLSKAEKKRRRKEIETRSTKSSDDPSAYEPFETDVDPKTGKKRTTKPSKHTLEYHDRYGEKAAGSVAKVSKATGIPKKILQEVYDRGLAAWRTGHRPGATQSAWAMARVYSFVTGGKTWKTADADLAKQARAKGFKPSKKREKNDYRSADVDELELELAAARPDLAIRDIVYLGQGVDSIVYGATLDGRAVVLKTLEEPQAILAGEDALNRYLATGRHPRGIAGVFDIIDLPMATLIIQERAYRLVDLDARGQPPVGGVAAPVLAESLETALERTMVDFMRRFADIYGRDYDLENIDVPELDDLEMRFAQDLEHGSRFLAEAGGFDYDQVGFDWKSDNVGIVERKLPGKRKTELEAVILDLGLVT